MRGKGVFGHVGGNVFNESEFFCQFSRVHRLSVLLILVNICVISSFVSSSSNIISICILAMIFEIN